MTNSERDEFTRAVAALGITDAVSQLRLDIRDMRHEMGELRSDLAITRTTVARLEGRQEGEIQRVEQTWRWREQFVAVAAAVGVLLGAIATVHPF